MYYCDTFRANVEADDSANNRKRKANPSLKSNTVRSPLKALKSEITDKIPEEISVVHKFEKINHENKIENILCTTSSKNNTNFCEELNDKLTESSKFCVNNPELTTNLYIQSKLNLSNDDNSYSVSGKSSDDIFEKSCESLTINLDPKIVNDNLSTNSKTRSSDESYQKYENESFESLPVSIESDLSDKVLYNEKGNSNSEELSLSQWSKGQFMLNGEKIEVILIVCF